MLIIFLIYNYLLVIIKGGGGGVICGFYQTVRNAKVHFNIYCGATITLQYIEGIFSKKTYVICTDSLSSLEGIGKNTIEHNIGKQIIETLLILKNNIKLMWVPSHQGISGVIDLNCRHEFNAM